MFRVLAALFLLNIVLMLTDGIFDAGGGVQATELTADLSATGTIIYVEDTEGFAAGNMTITIGLEDIIYTSKDSTHFYTNAALRGVHGTEAASHADGDLVYTPGAALINEMLNYDITTTETGAGASGEAEGSVVSVNADFWERGLPKMFTWNYGIFNNGDLVIIRYILMGLCGILTAIIALKMLPFINF